uniref:Semaphorin 4B n=1 Tax=Molossus molossus TaxID=27622 RepID=A0A7J8BL41_MOLMO|nr:semaphorin 4B [Molossus molossus]
MRGEVGAGRRAVPAFEREESGDFKPWARGLSKMKGVLWAAPGKETVQGRGRCPRVQWSHLSRSGEDAMAGGTRPPSPLLLLLLLLPPPAIWGLVPRISLPLGSEERPFLRFQTENVSNYTALLLSRDGKTLYVGAREALFALNSSTSFLPGGRYQELLWSADAERKYQCSFKGKDPQVSQRLKGTWAAGGMKGGGPGPRTAAGVGADAASCGGRAWASEMARAGSESWTSRCASLSLRVPTCKMG